MSATLLAVALSLVSAVAYAAAAVAQERLAARMTDGGGQVRRLFGSGAWWSAVGLNAAAALLHVAALKFGPLTLVQPLGALTLVAAVPLGARLAGRRVTGLEWRGTGLTLIGLGALLLTASGPEPDDTLSLPEAVTVAALTMTVIGLLSRPGTRPGLRHATASGFASGVASALTQTVTVAATDRSGPVLSGQVVVVALLVAALAVGGLLLSQTAYRGGLGAPLAVVTLANPLAASAIGVALLGERLRGGVGGVLLAMAGALIASYGVVVLTRSPRQVVGEGPVDPVESPPPGPALAAEPTASVLDAVEGGYLPSIPVQPEPATVLRVTPH
ncbi:DMT family transporter [Streptomyces aureocirculatus]|uniref:DMT family transporter n=1 Tax=Streptomyces aureocirculatus TaxID=67275 RepID=UPI0004CA99C8|nr:DMT family transporter [Streptomyces aureocirculatus]